MKSNNTFIFIVIVLLVLSVVGLFRSITSIDSNTPQDAYYRGVYDTCVHLSAVNGQVTLFDLVQCKEIEQHARADGWYLEESVKP